MPTEQEPYSYSFGDTPELYVEYMKRSEAFTMSVDHYHAYYEIYYMLSGKRLYFIRDRSYAVEQGDLVFIPKHELHKTMHAGEAAHERVIIHFDDATVEKWSSEHFGYLLSSFRQDSPIIRLPLSEQNRVEQLIRQLLSEIEIKPTGYELIPGPAITELLLIAARYVEQHDFAPMQHETPMHAKITEVVRHINTSYAEPLRLGDLSERFFISSYYLSRMFKEITGFAFSDYVVLTRIKEAQRLLRDSDSSISEIAVAVGFENFSHFGKMFKKIARQSPRDYRKQYGKS